MSVTIEVELTDDLIPLLERKARHAGLGREEYLRALVSRDLTAPASLEVILGPFRNQVAASGITDDELSNLFNEARADAEVTAVR